MDGIAAGHRFGSLLPRMSRVCFWSPFLIRPAAAFRALVTGMAIVLWSCRSVNSYPAKRSMEKVKKEPKNVRVSME